MKKFVLDAGSAKKPLPHYWELCVGSCHGTTALREDYRDQLLQCSRELGFKYVRFHGLFDDDMSVLIKGGGMPGMPSGNEGYKLSFTNTDSIFDFLLSIGMKPFVELGFMPEALTTGPTNIFHYKGHTSPPDDFEKWQWFIEQFALHCIDRYGLDEVRQWFFEVWNEPDLGGKDAPMGFWGGTQEEYFKLYEYAARGLKNVDKKLRVGGPATSANKWIPETIAYCKENNIPLDFISTHHYPTDDVIGMNIDEMMKMREKVASGEILQEEARKMMGSFMKSRDERWREVKRGTLKKMAAKAKAESEGLPLYYTEWNSLAGLPSDGPFGASFIAKTVMDNVGLVEGYSYWTFSDLFEESGMPSAEFHGGYGLMTLHGIPKSAYRAFELLHRLGNEMYDEHVEDGTVDIYAVSKPVSNAVQLLVVNHNSFVLDIADEKVSLKVEGLPSFVKATVERIDDENGNALGLYEKIGSPEYITKAQKYGLLEASCTESVPVAANFADGTAELELDIPAQGIALVTLYM